MLPAWERLEPVRHELLHREPHQGLDLAAVGALLVQVKGSVELVTTVVGVLRSWLRRGSSPRRTVRISIDGRTLELSAASDEQQQRLVEEFVRALPHG